jgi:hypothetical protein
MLRIFFRTVESTLLIVGRRQLLLGARVREWLVYRLYGG